MSRTGKNKVKNDAVIDEMVASGWFRVNDEGRIETCYQWRACREYNDRPWRICDAADGKGYRYVSFRHSRVKAHRLAYALHHRTSLDRYEINHLDGDRLNNKKDNLELCDAKRQSEHAYDTGLNLSKGVMHPKAIFTEDDIRSIRKRHKDGEGFTKISKDYNTSGTCIRYICIRHTWKHIK